jgi:hypothetical protein
MEIKDPLSKGQSTKIQMQGSRIVEARKKW